jgi:UDP-N-acetylglucosamine acyltransferase
MASVHPTAIVAADAGLAPGVEIGPYSVVGAEVSIGEGTVIGAHVVIATRTAIGRNNRIFQFASIGEIPQDRKYDGAPTRTVIGDGNVIREFVTIHAGTAQDRGVTTVGNGNWLLAYSHIAHDCVVGNDTTFSNNAQLAGHVVIEDFAVLGGFVGVHQFCRVGAHAFVAAGSIVLQDVPPFVTVAGYPAKPHGTNSEGLRRRGFSAGDLAAIKRAYKTLYRAGLPLEQARAKISEEAISAPVLKPLAAFLENPGRGLVR